MLNLSSFWASADSGQDQAPLVSPLEDGEPSGPPDGPESQQEPPAAPQEPTGPPDGPEGQREPPAAPQGSATPAAMPVLSLGSPTPALTGTVQYLPVTGTGTLIRWTGELSDPQGAWLDRYKATRIDHLHTAWLRSRPPAGVVMPGAVVDAPAHRRWATLSGVLADQFGTAIPGTTLKGSETLPDERWHRPVKVLVWVAEDGWVLRAQDVPEGMGDERIARYVYELTGQQVGIPDAPLPWGEWSVGR